MIIVLDTLLTTLVGAVCWVARPTTTLSTKGLKFVLDVVDFAVLQEQSAHSYVASHRKESVEWHNLGLTAQPGILLLPRTVLEDKHSQLSKLHLDMKLWFSDHLAERRYQSLR